MANIMQQKDIRNNPSRSGFDLSNRNCFSAKVGQLLPVYCKEVLPGDKFDLSPQWFTRTRPVNTAAFTRFREYFDFFFVPTRLLWQFFPSFVMQMPNDNAAVINGIPLSTPIPSQSFTQPQLTTLELETYLQLWNIDTSDSQQYSPKYYDMFGFKRYDNWKRLLNYLGYGNFNYLDQYAAASPSTSDIVNHRVNRPLSPWPIMAYHKIYNDFFRYDQWENSNPLLWNCNYHGAVPTTQTANFGGRLNTVWQQLFALQSQQLSRIFDLPFDIHYCNWNKDLFTGLLPSAQYGDVATVNISPSGDLELGSPLYIGDRNNSVIQGAGLVNAGDTVGTLELGSSNRLNSVNNSVEKLITQLTVTTQQGKNGLSAPIKALQAEFNILALRQAEFKQKWAEISNSHRRDYRSQVAAHFGVNLPQNLSGMCEYVGGCASNVSINEVVNNNITGDNSADIAGKGIGSGSGRVSFTAKEHGVFMCIYHVLPLLDWAAFGLDKFCTKVEPTDYAIPEMDRVGMEVVDLSRMFDTPDISSLVEQNKTSLGYAPRYIDYKTSVDEIHGAFLDNDTDGTWVTYMNSRFIGDYITQSSPNVRTSLIDYIFMKVNPHYVDSIFAADSDSTTATDQFFCSCYFQNHAVRNLDYDGLPY